MDPELYQRVKPVFAEAAELPPAARAAFLDSACAGDAPLRAAVERLLAHDRSQLVGDRTVARATAGQSADPEMVGPFHVLEKVGEGGMGTVYLAEQREPIHRQVAVKLVRHGVGGGQVLARFEAERQALALMRHPNIATVLDAGETADGQPYFAMEWVRGEDITTYCATRGLSLRERLALFVDVCDAIQHAHWKGIVHRDIKPGNVLAAGVDGAHVVKVIDFGIAKAVREPLTERTLHTHVAQVIGTPLYASPEQLEPGNEAVDFRSDVYSLGALLYELLTGTTPVDRHRASTSTFAELLQLVREVPARPSTRLRRAFTHGGAEVESMPWTPRVVAGDLDWITMKALEKEPDRRYEAPGALARDVQRYLSDEPVLAGPPTLTYRLQKFVKRHRGLVAGAAMTAVVLAGATWIVAQKLAFERAEGLIDTLIEAELARVPELAIELRELGSWTSHNLAERAAAAGDPGARLRLSLAMLPEDPSQAEGLARVMGTAAPADFLVLRAALEPHRDRLVPSLWARVEDPLAEPQPKFAAAAGLASMAPADPRWDDPQLRDWVVDQLVDVLPSELGPWREAFEPVREKLHSALTVYYGDPSRPADKRLFATEVLTHYAAATPRSLFELLLEADSEQFDVVLDALAKHRSEAVALADAHLREQAAAPDGAESAEPDPMERVASSRRAGNAAAALLRWDRPDAVWPLLRHGPDPNVRAQIIDRSARSGILPEVLMDRYALSAPDVRRALLLILGGLDPSRLEPAKRRAFEQQVTDDYLRHADAGLHSAATWWMAAWGLQRPPIVGPVEPSAERGWFVGAQGRTFVVVEPAVFWMGSPDSELGRHESEVAHQQRVERRFGIATTEVTRAEWREFCGSRSPAMTADNAGIERYAPTDECPQVGPTFYDALMFCNWLSELEGIPPDQWCYAPNEEGEFGPGARPRDGYLDLAGYRLPTEAEWELACRAGSRTSRPFGDDAMLLEAYAVFVDNEGDRAWPVRSRMPNDFGLFDILGNAYEWCDTTFENWPDTFAEVVDDEGSTVPVTNDLRKVLRGGSYNMRAVVCRSAYRNAISPNRSATITGIRPVRTLSW